MKLILAILVIVLLGLQYQLWFAGDGFMHSFRFKKQISEQQEKNKNIEKQNDLLVKEINSLKKGGVAIENRARGDLGMVKKGEVFYQVAK